MNLKPASWWSDEPGGVPVTAIVLRGDARSLPLPDASVDLLVTSPPYWGLRSYTDNGEHYDGQIGSEATPREYLDSLLACTREWMRVLKPGGNLFVELGDKYAGGGLRAKALLDLPHRYAIRCVDELGLLLRAEIIWHHVNGLPESVTDRVRRAHSTVFHLVRQPRYYAAVDEIREEHAGEILSSGARNARYGRPGGMLPGKAAGLRSDKENQAAEGSDARSWSKPAIPLNPLGKLPGSVWDIPSQPLVVPDWLDVDHFAAFPMELPRRIILGWSPPGVCTECGEGRRPVSASAIVDSKRHNGTGRQFNPASGNIGVLGRERTYAITGYACACPEPDAPTRPAVVVDPFGGTGTTALVASVFGRTGYSFDMSADYCRLARWRTRDPGERCRALGVPKPPPVPEDQGSLFDLAAP